MKHPHPASRYAVAGVGRAVVELKDGKCAPREPRRRRRDAEPRARRGGRGGARRPEARRRGDRGGGGAGRRARSPIPWATLRLGRVPRPPRDGPGQTCPHGGRRARAGLSRLRRAAAGAAPRQAASPRSTRSQEALARAPVLRRRGLATAIFLSLKLGRPLFLEGEAGTGKTEVAKVLADILGDGPDPPAVLRGPRRPPRRLRVELRAADDAHPPARVARRDAVDERELFGPDFLEQRPLLQAIDPARTKAPGPARRRDRPRRRGVRGVPARGALRLPDHDPRDRHDPAAHPPVVDRHLQPHARGPRRAEAPLPLLLDRLPVLRGGARDRPREGARGASERLAREVARFVQELRRAELYKLPGVAETLDWAAALVALDRQALDPAVVADTLGILLKYQDDVEKVRGEAARAMLDRVRAAG